MTEVARPDADPRAGVLRGFHGRYWPEHIDVCDVVQADCLPYGAR